MMSKEEKTLGPVTIGRWYEDDICDSGFITQVIMEVMTIGVSQLTTRIPITLYSDKRCNTLLQCTDSGNLTVCCTGGEHFCLANFFYDSISSTFPSSSCNITKYYIVDPFEINYGYCLWANAEFHR